jgi:hypothetical protein
MTKQIDDAQKLLNKTAPPKSDSTTSGSSNVLDTVA